MLYSWVGQKYDLEDNVMVHFQNECDWNNFDRNLNLNVFITATTSKFTWEYCIFFFVVVVNILRNFQHEKHT